MTFLEYLNSHPDRLRHLDTSTEFFDTCGIDAIYVDSHRNLVDLSTMSAFIKLHGGPSLRDEVGAMLSYLGAGTLLRHPLDTKDNFSDNVEALRISYKADRKVYPVRYAPDDPSPFFLRPETAFGFLRHCLKHSEEMYGQRLQVHNSLVPKHAARIIYRAFEVLKIENPLAAYLAAKDIIIKLQTRTEARHGKPDVCSLDVYVNLQGKPSKHSVLALAVDSSGYPQIPELRDIMLHPNVNKHLPNFA